MKKILFLAVVLIIVSLSLLPWYTSKLAKEALDDPSTSSNTAQMNNIFQAVEWKMLMTAYNDARLICEKAIILYPENRNSLQFFLNKAAICSEREKLDAPALFWYKRLVEEFPDSPYTSNAKEKVLTLEERQGS